MARIVGIAGSFRRGSHNTALLRAARALAPAGTEVEIASIAGIPLYDGDLESERGIPEPVAALKDRIAAAEGLLLVTPEYNHSMPGVLKNAVDWLSRPPKDIPRVFGGQARGDHGCDAGLGRDAAGAGRMAAGVAGAWHARVVRPAAPRRGGGPGI